MRAVTGGSTRHLPFLSEIPSRKGNGGSQGFLDGLIISRGIGVSSSDATLSLHGAAAVPSVWSSDRERCRKGDDRKHIEDRDSAEPSERM